MTFALRITEDLARHIRRDLSRVHDYAAERVGFIGARPAETSTRTLLLAASYHPVADSDYVDDPSLGAMMGPEAVRMALQTAYTRRVCMLHVHAHEHLGMPWFSELDLREHPKFVLDFFNVQPSLPHGALVFSKDRIAGFLWSHRGAAAVRIDEISEVGAPLHFHRGPE